jgi:shikimate dehydrogenase
VASPDERFLVGLIGADIGTSMSPALHEREADRHGLRYLYEVVDLTTLGLAAADVGELVTAAQRLGFRGLNITHPCKQEVLKYLDDLSPEAAELGAVNTVVFDRGGSTGYNTDRYGFAAGLARALPGVPTARVVLLGAGGAGAAVASAMARSGTRHLTVVDVDVDRARRLAEALSHHAGLIVETATPGGPIAADGLINATPIGMEGHPGVPIAAEALAPGMWVADVVYRPLETELLRAARARGCRTAAGGGMVVFQAAEAFRLFTGRAPDEERMYRDFEELTGDA